MKMIIIIIIMILSCPVALAFMSFTLLDSLNHIINYFPFPIDFIKMWGLGYASNEDKASSGLCSVDCSVSSPACCNSTERWEWPRGGTQTSLQRVSSLCLRRFYPLGPLEHTVVISASLCIVSICNSLTLLCSQLLQHKTLRQYKSCDSSFFCGIFIMI